MEDRIFINNTEISQESKTYIIAEMSGNHNQDFNRAKKIIDEAKQAGADAVKLQTYTADTITIDCDSDLFQAGGLWKGKTLYDLYQEAYTPWEWQKDLKDYANSIGLDCFSSPFDLTAIDFLENMNVPAYKIASFEINDIPFIRKIARIGKPIMISTGIAFLEDIELALRTCEEEGNHQVILLKCVSEYPAPFEDVNLNTIPTLSNTFHCITGLSDHTLGDEIAVASVAMGAKVIEKHFTLRRSDGGPDCEFSMEPEEFAIMTEKIRHVEKAMGSAEYKLPERQIRERKGSRSLFVVKDICKGEVFTEENVRSIRPGVGMHTKYYEDILGKKARIDLKKGTPMEWKYVSE